MLDCWSSVSVCSDGCWIGGVVLMYVEIDVGLLV